jgi:hypothetical protein
LGVEEVDACLPFMGSVLWKRDDKSKPFIRRVVLGCNEFDDSRSVDEEASCLLAEGVNILWVWPILREFAVAPVSGDRPLVESSGRADIAVHRMGFDVVEPEHVRVRLKRLQSESGANPGLWSAGDEEFDKRDLVHITGEDGEKCRCGLLVLALVEGIDDDERLGLLSPGVGQR